MSHSITQSLRPLTPAGVRIRVRRLRQLCDLIERYADPATPREQAQRTRAMHNLSLSAQDLSARNRRSLLHIDDLPKSIDGEIDPYSA